MDRKALVLAEFKTFLPDDTTVLQIMHLSEVAYENREARRKAIQDGKVWHG